jgi:hypothetical protein
MLQSKYYIDEHSDHGPVFFVSILIPSLHILVWPHHSFLILLIHRNRVRTRAGSYWFNQSRTFKGGRAFLFAVLAFWWIVGHILIFSNKEVKQLLASMAVFFIARPK